MQVKHINREEYKEELDANGSERRNNLKKKTKQEYIKQLGQKKKRS